MPFVLEVIIKVKLNLIILGVDSMQYLYLILVAEKLVSSISAFLFVSGVISPKTFFLLNNFPEAGCLVFVSSETFGPNPGLN